MRFAWLSMTVAMAGAGSARAAPLQPLALRRFVSKERAAGLLRGEARSSASLRVALGGDLERRLEEAADRFARTVADGLGAGAELGGGDRATPPADPVAAFALGTLAGLGLAHYFLLHDHTRGLYWLLADASLIATMAVLLALAPPLGALSVGIFIVERVAQGLDALAGTGKAGFIFGDRESGGSDSTRRFAALRSSDVLSMLSLKF